MLKITPYDVSNRTCPSIYGISSRGFAIQNPFFLLRLGRGASSSLECRHHSRSRFARPDMGSLVLRNLGHLGKPYGGLW
jgi:hypothetical protein